MGEVYRATDTRLARDIALKVLPSVTTADADLLARFQREARAVAALNHPGIVTVHSVEEAGNVHFITMELIEGQPLDHLIPDGGMPADQTIEIGSAIAEALTAAHERGIVHRDLKPANVMVTKDGRVKVLDFGLAKDVSAVGLEDATLTSAGLTKAGVVMGTPAYMSPEQLSGRPLDHRTDIFSVGAVLFEMATGRRPFAAESSAELISSIMRDDPLAASNVRQDLPSELASIIRRCLEKDPRCRFQTAREMSIELRKISQTVANAPSSPATAVRSTPVGGSGAIRAEEGFWVAVLPFRATGSDPDLKALAEGLSEEVITGFSRFSYMRVIGSASTARYSGASGDVRTIGRELGARYLMEGSLRQAGGKLRVAVNLVDVVTGAYLWAETYERAYHAEAIFEIQDDLVPRIVATVADIHGVLPHSMSELLWQAGQAHFTPHEALVRAFRYDEKQTAEEHAFARQILEKAVAEAPANSDCWAALANAYVHEWAFDRNPLPDPLTRAHAAARHAVHAAPSSALAHTALANVLFFQRDALSFLPEAERALKLNPMSASIAAVVGMLLAYSGEWERGTATIERACQLNPHHPAWYYMPLFLNAYRKKDYPVALTFAAKVDTPAFVGFSARAATYGQLGELELARQQLNQLLALVPNYASMVRQRFSKWYEPDVVEHYIDGLRKAGLELPDE